MASTLWKTFQISKQLYINVTKIIFRCQFKYGKITIERQSQKYRSSNFGVAAVLLNDGLTYVNLWE